MGRNIPNKNRTRKRTKRAKITRNSACRRYGGAKRIPTEDLQEKESLTISTEVYLNNNGALESTYDLPVIAAVHGKDYFEKHPFSGQLNRENEAQFETTDSTVIKIEACEEENNLQDKMDKPVLKTIPETLQQCHPKDQNILSTQINNSCCNFMHLKAPTFSCDKEDKLLNDIIKYLDECARADKFDLAGKLYAAKLRSVNFTNQQAIAENLCRQVLLEAEHFNLDEKIVLSGQHPQDYLSYRKGQSDFPKKSNLEQSFHIHLGKDTLFQNIQNRLLKNTIEDRFDKFGKFYATKMRSFSDVQYFFADKLINEIVLEAELCRLRANFKLTKLGDPPSRTFTSGKSYAKKYRIKLSVLPASDIACVSNKASLKQSDQFPVKTDQKSVDKQKVPSSKVNNKVLKTRKHTKTVRKYISKQFINESGDKEFKNSSFKASIGSLIPTDNVLSVQNNANQFPESLSSSSISNTFLTPNSTKAIQFADKQLINSSVGGVENSSFKSLILPLAPTPAVISIQNNASQFSGKYFFINV